MNKTLKRQLVPLLLFAVVSVTGGSAAPAVSVPPSQNRTDLALGKKVLFSPQPKGSKAANAGLTDGKLSQREDQDLWLDNDSAKWSYPGQFNLAVDLGQIQDIDEIAIRLQNGSPTYTENSGRVFPGRVEAFVSDDGESYRKVAEFSKWNPGEFEKFGIGQGRNVSRVDSLRFTDLKTHGRWVGLRIYGTSRTASDEIYVFGKSATTDKSTFTEQGTPSGFTVAHPEVYFHKPYLEVATNIPLPVPVGIIVPKGADEDVNLDIDLPPGLDIAGGNIAPGGGINKIDFAKLTPQELPDGWKRYSISQAAANISDKKDFGRLYLQATSWKDGQDGELRYRFGSGKWQSPQLSIPVRAVLVPAAPRLKTIMTSLGWSNSLDSFWPDQLQVFKTLGLNTVNFMTKYGVTKTAQNDVNKARKQGFFISTIDSPLSDLVQKAKKAGKAGQEAFEQLPDGKVTNKLDPSYRGKFYQEELQRFAQATAQIKPDFVSMDIEPWGNAGPSKDCQSCQADFKASGLATWDEWLEKNGREIITDLVGAARDAVQKAGGKPFTIGSYNVSPEHIYQGGVFDFKKLYPQVLDNSQGSTYSNLQPADLVFIGDKARNARAHMPKSDVMPWLTPGDAGTFSGDDFTWMLLEAYTNGSRGIWFWSHRVWDAESLIAYNKVIRAIAPVEDVIVNGDLVGSAAAVEGEGRVSGMKLDSRMVLLAADYFGKSGGTIKLHLDVPQKSTLRDLFTGETIGASLEAGAQTISIPLNGKQARLFEVVPVG